jgi:hypothetical protein
MWLYSLLLLLLLLLLVTHHSTVNLHIYNVERNNFYTILLTKELRVVKRGSHEHHFYQAFFLHNRVNNLG